MVTERSPGEEDESVIGAFQTKLWGFCTSEKGERGDIIPIARLKQARRRGLRWKSCGKRPFGSTTGNCLISASLGWIHDEHSRTAKPGPDEEGERKMSSLYGQNSDAARRAAGVDLQSKAGDALHQHKRGSSEATTRPRTLPGGGELSANRERR